MNKKLLHKLLYKLLYLRLLEEEIVKRYPNQEMRCPTHLCIGQEAVAVGTCENLSKKDVVFSNHRAHGHYLAKGGNLESLIAELYGKESGCCGGRGGSMHLVDLSVNFLGSTPIVGDTIPIATGAALSLKMKKQNNISVVFFGDGATEEGVFHESLNFASLKKLPVLFICENNFYSVFTPFSERQPNREIYKLAEVQGLHSIREKDGNNVLKVYENVNKCIDYMKNENEPAFIEFLTYRYLEHCGPYCDDHFGYRPKSEINKWKNKCPVVSFKKYLLKNNLIDNKKIEEYQVKIMEKIGKAFDLAYAAKFPRKSSLEDHVYSKLK